MICGVNASPDYRFWPRGARAGEALTSGPQIRPAPRLLGPLDDRSHSRFECDRLNQHHADELVRM
jgi:hypothetical protein